MCFIDYSQPNLQIMDLGLQIVTQSQYLNELNSITANSVN
jgi:hypothetical protein